ncbi:unnamed protein product [Spirodela intermedia]|uniref:Uncharacterized protein n=1 Tax=Spirodela intermedia TaxID=51605 RepID=A0A7I8L6K2_SPIIN|nr:unnamed protein product [Spirodela intermedia]
MELRKLLPIPSPVVCSISKAKTLEDLAVYQSVVDALQYLSLTQPNISFGINKACHSIHSPKDADSVHLKHLLQYLKGTVTHGLYITASSNLTLTAYSDADWAGNASDR